MLYLADNLYITKSPCDIKIYKSYTIFSFADFKFVKKFYEFLTLCRLSQKLIVQQIVHVLLHPVADFCGGFAENPHQEGAGGYSYYVCKEIHRI